MNPKKGHNTQSMNYTHKRPNFQIPRVGNFHSFHQRQLQKTKTPFIGKGSYPNQHISPPHPEPEEDEIEETRSNINNSSHCKRTASTQARSVHILPQTTSSINYDLCLEDFLNKLANHSISNAIETFFKSHFSAKQVVFWEEIPEVQCLFSHNLSLTTPHSSGVVGYSLFSRSIIRSSNIVAHPSYQQSADGVACVLNMPALIFPIWDFRNQIFGVVEIFRPVGSSEFTQEDENFVQWFSNRFKQLSRWICPSLEPNNSNSLQSLNLDITEFQRSDQFITIIPKRLASFFHSRNCEIWGYIPSTDDHSQKAIARFGQPDLITDSAGAGIAGDALVRSQVINILSNRFHPAYNPDVDGDTDEAVLAVPILSTKSPTTSESENESECYVIVLRGPSKSVYTQKDLFNLKKIAPLVIQCFSNTKHFTLIDDKFQHSRVETQGLAALLDVVEVLSQQLDTGKLVNLIMEKGRSLTNSDRCSLFLVNEAHDKLISYLQQGLDKSIEVPIDKGIVGKSLKDKTILNIPDVYESDFFDPSTDQESGYRTRSILSVPIFNNRGETIGVTEMVNKADNKPFTDWDIKLIQIFNVFCGISLENAKLYNESKEMASQLRSFFNTSFSLAKSENIKPLLEDIMNNARTTIGAERASLFLVDETTNVFVPFIADGSKLPSTVTLTSGIVALCGQQKHGVIENDAYHNPNFNRAIDIKTGFKTISILASPVLTNSGKLLGVAEMVNKENGFNEKDLNVLNAFTAFSSVALENSRLKDIAAYGDVEYEVNKWIGESERSQFIIPVKMQLKADQVQKMFTLNFFSVDFIGIDHFRELFFFFNHFKVLETFKISSEQFFRFVYTISRTYNKVPYHNWTHACDVCQYVSYELETANASEIMTSHEIFGLLTAAVCHDANHEGFNNIFNVKMETPLGILFKDQSVMEMHHITISIPIILQDDINLFHSLSAVEVKKMWQLFIKLILATDMAHHFELVKQTQSLLDDKKWDMNDPEHRILSLQLLLKVADISNVSRPFDIADKWCDILNNEFFRQGDIEKSSGIGFTSPMNDREHPNKPKSQIGFYNFICIPLYQTVARIFPQLTVNAESVKSNLSIWMELADKDNPPAENSTQKK